MSTEDPPIEAPVVTPDPPAAPVVEAAPVVVEPPAVAATPPAPPAAPVVDIAAEVAKQVAARLEAATTEATAKARADVEAEMKIAADREAMSALERAQAELADEKAKTAAAQVIATEAEAATAATNAKLDAATTMAAMGVAFPSNAAGIVDRAVEDLAYTRIAEKIAAGDGATTATAIAALKIEAPWMFSKDLPAVEQKPTSTTTPAGTRGSVVPTTPAVTGAKNAFRMSSDEWVTAQQEAGAIQ